MASKLVVWSRIALVVIVVLLVGVWLYPLRIALFLSPSSELPFRADEFEDIINAYTSGELGDEKGRVPLPADRSGLTSRGYMHVTEGYSCGDIFLFVTWRGKGSNLQGYIYCPGVNDYSSFLTEPDYYGVGYLMINGPNPNVPGGYSKVPVEVVEPMDRDGWCYVAYNLN